MVFIHYSTEDASWVALSPEASTWEGSLASKAWRLLERHLQRHDSAPVYRYRLVVLERVLATNRDGKIPTFLTDFLLRNQPQTLLKTLIRFDRLSEAFRYSLETIQVRSSASLERRIVLTLKSFCRTRPSLPQISALIYLTPSSTNSSPFLQATLLICQTTSSSSDNKNYERLLRGEFRRWRKRPQL